MEKGRRYTEKEIIKKLMWFHGDEFEKYPLYEEYQHLLHTKK